jgi:SET domain-containing protein
MAKKERPKIDGRYARFALRVRRSRIEGWGVYAGETIPRRRLVIEYTGEKISRKEANRRVWKTCRNPRTRKLTMYGLGAYWRIDAANGGSGAELVNHSCEPNLKARIWRGRVLFHSLRRIRAREEVTVDYAISPDTFRVRCRCGAKKCRGTINRLK